MLKGPSSANRSKTFELNKNVRTITILNERKERQCNGFCGNSYIQKTVLRTGSKKKDTSEQFDSTSLYTYPKLVHSPNCSLQHRVPKQYSLEYGSNLAFQTITFSHLRK